MCPCTYSSKLRSSAVGRLSSFTASFNALFFFCGSDRLRSHVYRHMTSEKPGRISRIRSLCSCTYCSKLRSSDVGRLTSFTASFNAHFLCGSDRLRSHAYRHMTSEKVGQCWQTARGWVSKHSTISYVRYNFLLRVVFLIFDFKMP